MPTNKNAMTRYKILDKLLSNRYHHYSIDDLTDEVSKQLADMYPDTNGIGRRAIEKDIKYIEYEGPFLAEIERYSVPCYDSVKGRTYSKRCLRYANPSYSIFKKEMTDDEEYLLREALSILGQFDGLPNLDNLERLRLGLGVRSDDKRIISLSKNPLKNYNLFGELFTAISQKQVIELHYHVFAKPDDDLHINIHPYLLKEYNRRWYLICAAESDRKVLTFGLDRIDKIVPLLGYKYVPFDGDINERFEDIIGITLYNNAPLADICFWVSDDTIEYVQTKPIHASQHEATLNEEESIRNKYPHLLDGKIFWIHCRKNYELIRELSSFGSSVLVLYSTDESIKKDIFERISHHFSAYQKLRI